MKPANKIKTLSLPTSCSVAILVALVIAVFGHAPVVAAQANWTQTYHDGGHTGYNSTEKTLGTGNVGSLQLLWAASVAGGVTAFAVDDGVVYATGQANNLVALNATTGAQLWSVNTGGNNYFSSAVVATGGGLVFTECFFPDTGGDVYDAVCAYKESTGKMVWQWSNPCNCLPEASLEAAFVYSSGVLYIPYSSGGGDQTHGIYAVHAASGKQIWGVGAFSNGFGVGAAAVAGTDVYVDIGQPTQLDALSTSSGSVTWSAPVSDASTAVSVSAGVVYASTPWTGTEATVYALNATTGATLWTYTYGTQSWCGSAAPPSPPAIAKGAVYFQGVDGNLYALHTKNGKLLWADTPNNNMCGFAFSTSPSIANGVVYINGGDSAGFAANTTAYNATTGVQLWASPSEHGTLEMPPVVVNGILYFASPGDSICESICAYSAPVGAESE